MMFTRVRISPRPSHLHSSSKETIHIDLPKSFSLIQELFLHFHALTSVESGSFSFILPGHEKMTVLSCSCFFFTPSVFPPLLFVFLISWFPFSPYLSLSLSSVLFPLSSRLAASRWDFHLKPRVRLHTLTSLPDLSAATSLSISSSSFHLKLLIYLSDNFCSYLKHVNSWIYGFLKDCSSQKCFCFPIKCPCGILTEQQHKNWLVSKHYPCVLDAFFTSVLLDSVSSGLWSTSDDSVPPWLSPALVRLNSQSDLRKQRFLERSVDQSVMFCHIQHSPSSKGHGIISHQFATKWTKLKHKCAVCCSVIEQEFTKGKWHFYTLARGHNYSDELHAAVWCLCTKTQLSSIQRENKSSCGSSQHSLWSSKPDPELSCLNHFNQIEFDKILIMFGDADGSYWTSIRQDQHEPANLLRGWIRQKNKTKTCLFIDTHQ